MSGNCRRGRENRGRRVSFTPCERLVSLWRFPWQPPSLIACSYPQNTSSCLICLCPVHTTMHIGQEAVGRGCNGAESLCRTGYEKFTFTHKFKKKKRGSKFSCSQMLILRLLFVALHVYTGDELWTVNLNKFYYGETNVWVGREWFKSLRDALKLVIGTAVAVGIATGYGLDDREVGVRVTAG
jgi:hypothetical protein